MGEGGGGEALSLFRFHLSPFPPETPDTQAIASLATTILSKQRHRVFTLFTITGKLQKLQNNSNV